MAEASKPTLFCLDCPFDGSTFKKVIEDAGYCETALAETLGIACAHDRQDVEVVYRRVRTDSPYNILVRLFWLGRPVSESAVQKMLPGLNLEELEGIGLLDRCDQMLCSNAKLGPYHDLLLASDFGPEVHRVLPADHVLGVGAASVTLANLTVRRKVNDALDLGCGAGIQGFLAARHADQVIGTDTNPRALNFAEFNARLNAIDNVEWRQGSFYEPIAEQRFDLIVTNPPFVISPESRFVFRDTDLPGDAVSEQVVGGAGERLNDGGFACILFNWHHESDEDWDSRPRSWVSTNTGCDAWMMCFKSTEPLVYAADWLGTSVGRSSPDYGRYLDEWMAYYEKMGIGRISAGAMILRRRSGQANWFRAHAIDKGRGTGSSAEQIDRIFAAEDLLQMLDDKALMEQRLLFDKNHLLEHRLRAENGRWVLCGEHLCASEGIPFAGHVDMYIANLLAGCDGRRTLRELIAVAAGPLQANPEQLTPACLKAVRRLMQSGFLSAVGESGESAR